MSNLPQNNPSDPSNPLGLTTEYIWEPGDTMMLIAYKYRRPGQFTELLELNKAYLSKCRHLSRPGDVIKIPESWFPLPTISYGTKFIGSKGERIL